MATAIPSIACIGIIGRNNNPLHIQIFPSHNPSTNTFAPIRTPLQFSLLLSSTLDIFELRHGNNNSSAGGGAAAAPGSTGTGLSGEVGLLHAVDERLAAYGWETNTGVKIVVVVDMRGRRVGGGGGTPGAESAAAAAAVAAAKGRGAVGLREQELRVVFRAVQSAYVRLLQNPFYEPDEHSPVSGRGGRVIKSRKFEGEVRRVGEGWTPGVTTL